MTRQPYLDKIKFKWGFWCNYLFYRCSSISLFFGQISHVSKHVFPQTSSEKITSWMTYCFLPNSAIIWWVQSHLNKHPPWFSLQMSPCIGWKIKKKIDVWLLWHTVFSFIQCVYQWLSPDIKHFLSCETKNRKKMHQKVLLTHFVIISIFGQ